MAVMCGIDWAEAHHDVAAVDENGTILGRRRIRTDVGGFSDLLEFLAQVGAEPGQTPIAIETEKNLIVTALTAAGFIVYPINPRAVARYRERHGQAGGKSDAGDAVVLANVVRTDLHAHRPLPAVTIQAQRIKVLARQHQEAIWAWHQTNSRLRSLLLDFYPQALQAFPSLKHHAATAFLAAAPTPAAAQRLTRRKAVAILHRCGRRNDAGLADRILTDLQAPSLRQPRPIEDAFGVTVVGLISVVVAMRAAVDQLEAELAVAFDAHPLAPVLRSAPGLGPVLAARVLAEVGDDPTRFTTASGLRAFAGTAPVTRASGRSQYVKARSVRRIQLEDGDESEADPGTGSTPPGRGSEARTRERLLPIS